MKVFKLTVLITVTILVCSCVNKQMSADEKEIENITAFNKIGKEKQEDQKFYSDSTGAPGNTGSDKKQQPSQVPIKQDWDKKIIKTANLNLEVKDYNVYYSSLREKVKNIGGYIAQEEQTQSDYKIENTISIKVPVDQFDNAVAQLTTNIEKLNEKKISSNDVTAEFVDTRSRMEAKKQVRQCYMDLLNQAKNMEEILSVQSEINGIQEQIESGLGRIEYLSHSSVFSTINITYFQVLNSSAKNDDKPSFGQKITNAFKTGWNFISDLFIGLVSVWPLYFLIFLAVIIYRRVKAQKPKEA